MKIVYAHSENVFQNLQVAGNFTSWEVKPMHKDMKTNFWEFDIDLKNLVNGDVDKIVFKFVDDNGNWFTDDNFAKETDTHNNENNVKLLTRDDKGQAFYSEEDPACDDTPLTPQPSLDIKLDSEHSAPGSESESELVQEKESMTDNIESASLSAPAPGAIESMENDTTSNEAFETKKKSTEAIESGDSDEIEDLDPHGEGNSVPEETTENKAVGQKAVSEDPLLYYKNMLVKVLKCIAITLGTFYALLTGSHDGKANDVPDPKVRDTKRDNNYNQGKENGNNLD